MRPNPIPIPLIALCALSFGPAALPARAAALDLPVWTPGSSVKAPCYRGDVLELRLSPAAARAVLPRGAGPTRARAVGRLGVPAIDALAASLDLAAFEPEFRGEMPPTAPGDPDFTAFHLVHLGLGGDLATALARLRAVPEVLSADPIGIMPVSALPNDSLAFATFWLFKDQPVRTDIRAPEAWQISTGDTSIVVGIIDTGVIPYHPDLGGRAGERGQMWINWAEAAGIPGVDDDGNGFIDDYGGWDFVVRPTSGFAAPGEDARDEDNDPNDWGGHGTAIAGIIGAIPGNGIGLAGVVPQVRLMPLRIGWLQSGGLPPSGVVDMSYAAEAIRYATRNGATVVNCSWQSVNQSGLDAAVTAATRAGVVVVNASGNGGTSFTYLGQRGDVIAVTATDSSDVVWPNAVLGPWVDLAAAGVSMTSTMFRRLSQTDSLAGRTPAYQGFMNGTSFSAPQVTGAVALLQAQRRARGLAALTPAGVLARLRETADDISAQNPGLGGYGTGRLDLFRLLADPPRSTAVRARAQSVGPAVVLRDNTGGSRVVYAMDDGSLVAYDGTTGDTVWVQGLPGIPTGNLAAAEFGPPFGVLLAVAASDGAVHAFHPDGLPAAGWPQTAQEGARLDAGVTLADVTGDGVPEVIAGGTPISGSRLWVWQADGTLLPGFPYAVGTVGMSAPAAADLDGVPGAEIAFTDAAGRLRVIDQRGVQLRGFPTAATSVAVAPVIARLGHPGTPPSILLASAGQLAAYAPDGSRRWSVALAGSPVQDPALADLDGDGVDEVVLAMGSPNAIVVCDSSGAPFTGRPGWPAPDSTGVTGPPIVGPLGSAGGRCIAYFSNGGLKVLDATAQAVRAFPKPGGAGQSPSLDELDGDGATEIAAGTALADSNVYTYDAGAGSWAASLVDWPTPRGDLARTASHAAGTPGPFVIDRVRPARVTDLEAHALSTTSAVVHWTVTGDDSLTGTPARVVLRRAPAPLDETTFGGGILVPTGAPLAAGAPDSAIVTDLPEGSTWWFALRVLDRAGNRSALSNPDSASLPGLAPAAISDLRVLSVAESTVVLAWTATGDDGHVGRPLGYQIAASPTGLDSASFDSAPVQIRHPAFTDAGGGETLAVRPLTPGRRWRFALRAVDHALTQSGLSNVAEAVTPVGGALSGRLGVALGARPMPAAAAVTVDWQGDPGAAGPQWLLVYDLGGRELRRIPLGAEPGGSYNWDGRDGASRLLPAGLYFLRLVSGARHADSRVVFVR